MGLKPVADAAGISVTALISIEKGRSIPKPVTFRGICEALSVPPSYVMFSSIEEADIHPSRLDTFRAIQGVVLEIMRL